MPRDLPIGNGRMLLTFDALYHLRDFHYPRIGGENHTAGHPFRFGVWCDGQFGWVHDDDWQRTLDYGEDTLVTDVHLRSERMQLEIDCQDAVDFHENLYVRRLVVRNPADSIRQVRLFFHHDFHISDTDLGDTAYYHPYMRTVLHYKGPRYFLINGQVGERVGVSDFATGQKEAPGLEGTWRDAEGDGILGKNPIAQGAVDSTIALYVEVEAGGEAEAWYWMAAADTYRDAVDLNDLILDKGPETLLNRTGAYWRLWANKDDLDFDDLPDAIVSVYKRSLLVVRTQIDSGGAIIAANDTDNTQFNRDTYSYMWPRDGALVAHALDISGFDTLSADFYRFCLPLLTRDGYFLHKYNPDGSAGSSWHPWVSEGEPQLPIQEDETALVLWALWKHFDKFRDLEVIKPLYRDLIIRGAHFLSEYLDEAHSLPLPSYDLWEERRGVHSWTVGATYGGLIAAANFAAAFGEAAESECFHRAAATIRRGADTYLWSVDADRFVRSVHFGPDDAVTVDWTIDSSVAGLFLFGMYEAADPKVESTMKAVRERLWARTPVGGLARYENDYYHQVSQDVANVAGNPWFVCTLWLAQYLIARADTEEELRECLPVLQKVADHTLPSGVLAEQVHPYTGEPLSVSPLTWSHSSFITTVIEYLDRKSELSICPACSQPLFTKEQRKLQRLRAHKAIHV